MKKVLLIAAVALLGFSANAQVRLGLGLGYAIPMGDIADFTDGGIAANFELGYAVTEDIDVSIVAQSDFLAGADLDGASVGVVGVGSYLLNGRYYFTKEGFRPYGSLGIGLATVGSVDIESNGQTVEGEASSGLGIRPALGFKYGVLNMNVAYLNAGKTSADQSVSDLSINLGLLFTIGGN